MRKRQNKDRVRFWKTNRNKVRGRDYYMDLQ
jgi:hypothetical protein